MRISFANKKLEKVVNNDRLMLREFGAQRMLVIRRRLTQISDADNLEDLRHLPGSYHELVGNRKGLWSCDLDQPFRLIFRPQEQPIPVNDSGQYLWAMINGVEILEIVDYHTS